MNDSPGLKIKLAYLLGSAGYTAPFFLIALYLINFYNPPGHDSLPEYLYREPILGGLSILSVIIILGRALDVLADPFIAHLSDRSSNPGGRRLPFMKKAILPAAAAAFLVFYPPLGIPSILNFFWVLFFLSLCVTAFSAYVTPYLAHMSTLCKTDADRINLAMFQGLGESLGIILAGQAPFLWTAIQSFGWEPAPARQGSFAALAALSFLFMLVPLFAFRGTDLPLAPASQEADSSTEGARSAEYNAEENGRQKNEESFASSFFSGIRNVLSMRDFAVFVAAYGIFFACVELIQAGAYYYVTVLLELKANMLSLLLAIMVPSSAAAVPLAAVLAKKFGKKKVILGIILYMAALLFAATFLGKYPLEMKTQAFIFFILGGIPLGGMASLVMAVVTDLTERARARDGNIPEAMFVAGKNFSFKTGVTLGAAIFASLALLGKDRGDDLGIRVSCVVGAVFCLIAFTIFAAFYRDSPVLARDRQAGDAPGGGPGK